VEVYKTELKPFLAILGTHMRANQKVGCPNITKFSYLNNSPRARARQLVAKFGL
jgi:hypothetical protein